MKLIIGLGNPGRKYKWTRHNAGFIITEIFGKALGIKFKPFKKFNSEIAEAVFKNEKLILAQPSTFMNSSGLAVAAVKSFYKIKLGDILIINDDIDLTFGQIKFSVNAGPAGHNGVKSIIRELGSQNFVRLRIGIKEIGNHSTADKIVLKNFDLAEKQKLKREIAPRCLAAINAFLTEGVDQAMNRFN